MGLLGNISLWVRRRRHRAGHGVHSPFAYRVVRDVIVGGGGRYYTEWRFRRMRREFPRVVLHRYRLLFRLIARLDPGSIRIAGGVEPQVELVVRMANTKIFMAQGMGGYEHAQRVLTVCDVFDLRDGIPDGILASGNMVIVRNLHQNPSLLPRLEALMPGGWVFADRRAALFISDAGQPLSRLDVKM